MKPLVKVLLANRIGDDMKMAWIPLPLQCVPHIINPLVDRLGLDGELEDKEDEIVAYRSALGVVPDIGIRLGDVEETLEGVCKFTPEQFECLKTMLRVFSLKFSDIDRFLQFLQSAKNNEEENYYNE